MSAIEFSNDSELRVPTIAIAVMSGNRVVDVATVTPSEQQAVWRSLSLVNSLTN